MNGIRPLKLKAIEKEYIWGKEEWLLSCQHEGYEEIPLLIKRITAFDALSLQVHPDDAYAGQKEGCSGKTEMWYILDCKPDSCLYYGLKHRISANEFHKRIGNGTILEVCRKIPVKKGDVFYIPGGVVHAIGKGITVLEVQQSSDITYRIYDYQREDANHNKRELHVDRAADVACFVPPLQGHSPMGLCVQMRGYSKTLLVQCPYFTVYLYEIKENLKGEVGDSFLALYIMKGEGILSTENENLILKEGDCLFLPKGMGSYEIEGNIELLMSSE